MKLRGREKLAGVHPDLVRVIERAALQMPLVVLEGLRTPERQATLVKEGKSQTLKSRHLTGHAVDLAPDPIDWNDTKRFAAMGGYIIGLAESLGVHLRWGGDWDGDWNMKEHAFVDMPHLEIPA